MPETGLVLAVDTGIPRARVVAVVADLPGGREQVGSGYLVGGRLVLTAAHCARDKKTGAVPLGLRVIRASDGAAAEVMDLVADVVTTWALGVAVLRLTTVPWEPDLPGPVFARVDRGRSGMLIDCCAMGYPLFQRDPIQRARRTAELHGTIYQTDEAEVGRLLLREPLLTSVAHGEPPSGTGDGDGGSPWGGLSGALVFHAGHALGVVVEHHPRQGSAAVQVVAFDFIREWAETDEAARRVADALGLPPLDRLPWAAAQPVEPLAGLVDVLDPGKGDLPRVRDLDPYRLGTTSSDYGTRDSYGEHDPYVPRTRCDVDIRLRAALEPTRMVLLVGPSKVGKSRTAFEAVRARWTHAYLAAPAPGSLRRLAAHPRLQTSSDPLVVWLDDLDRFLTTAEPLTPAVLTSFSTRPGPTVVVATLRREARDLLRAATGELVRDTRAVLEGATTIELDSTADDPEEQAAAHAAYPDQPLDGSGLAERLGYAPQLLQAYDDSATANPLLHAVIRTAVDWARTSLSRPIPEPDLLEISSEVLWEEHPVLDATNDAITAAIRQARTPLPGSRDAATLITVPLPGRVRGYRAYDYLIAADDGQTGRPRPVPHRSWDDALHRADRDDAFAISVAAYARSNIPVSVRAAERAAEAGDTGAMSNLGLLLATRWEPPDLPSARAWLGEGRPGRSHRRDVQPRAPAGHPVGAAGSAERARLVGEGRRGRRHRRDVQPRAPAGHPMGAAGSAERARLVREGRRGRGPSI